MRNFGALLLLVLATLLTAPAVAAEPAPRLTLEANRKIWDDGRHNAFSSLARHQDAWFCAFRAGKDHAGDRGSAVVLRSADGIAWEKAAELTDKLYDLRDPKLCVMPDGRLMIVGGAVDVRRPGGVRFQELRSFVSFSEDGRAWSAPRLVLGEWEWLWRVTWHQGVGYGVAYHVGLNGQTPRDTRYGTLYRTVDGLDYEPIHRFQTPDGVGETTVRFDAADTMHLVMRRDGNQKRSLLGTAAPPYKQWKLADVDARLGGPDLIQLPSGQWLVGTRGHSGGSTILALADFSQLTLTPLLTVDDKAGDCSYPGLVWHEGKLWMSYYATHGGRTGIYLAIIGVDDSNTER